MVFSRKNAVFWLALCCAAAFGLIAWLVQAENTAGFDSAVIGFVQSAESPGLTGAAKFLAVLGSSKGAIPLSLAAMALLFVVFKHRLELLLFLWVGVGSNLINVMLKERFVRERPNIHRIVEEIGYSFPSGHSMAAVSLYGVLAFLLWRHIPTAAGRTVLIIAAAFMILVMGWSRIYLGVHYPSDVIAGYAASAAWLTLSIGLFERFRRPRPGQR